MSANGEKPSERENTEQNPKLHTNCEIAGARRLAAYKELGRDVIPATVVDLEKIVLGEYAENTFRLEFTPSECADIADDVEPIERALRRNGNSPANLRSGSIATRFRRPAPFATRP